MTLDYSTALQQKRLIRSVAGSINALCVYNSGPDQFLHVYDLATTTVSGTPVLIIPLPEDSSVVLTEFFRGVAFANGVLVANTTTDTTYSAGAADCWFTATHE